MENSHQIAVYIEQGGYRAVKKALAEFTPDAILDLVKAAQLRGRGERASQPASNGDLFLKEWKSPSTCVLMRMKVSLELSKTAT